MTKAIGNEKSLFRKTQRVAVFDPMAHERTATQELVDVDGNPLYLTEGGLPIKVSPTSDRRGGNIVPGGRADNFGPETHKRHGYGALLSEDDRDWAFPFDLLIPENPTIPSTPDEYFAQISTRLDQGETSMSVAYALRHLLSASPNPTLLGPSASELNFYAHVIEDYTEYAETIRRLSDPDLPETESREILLDEMLPLARPVSMRSGLQALRWRGAILTYHRAERISQIVDYMVYMRAPVLVASPWTEDMHAPISPEKYMNSVGTWQGNHVFLLEGWQGNRGAFRIANSFGPEWGHDGRAWLEAESLARLLLNGAQVYAITYKSFGNSAGKNRQDFLDQHPHFRIYLQLRGIPF